MTRQEIYDRVKQHLLCQGKRSMRDEEMCAYRGIGGLKCAIGILIPDNEYKPEFDYTVASIEYLIEDVPALKNADFKLLNDLQKMHDWEFPWEDSLLKIANKYNLKG